MIKQRHKNLYNILGLLILATTLYSPSAEAGFDPSYELLSSMSLTLTMATTGMGIGGAPIFVQKPKRHHYIQTNALALYKDVSVGGGSVLEGLATLYGMHGETKQDWMRQTRDPIIRAHLKEIIQGQSPEHLDQALVVLSLGFGQR